MLEFSRLGRLCRRLLGTVYESVKEVGYRVRGEKYLRVYWFSSIKNVGDLVGPYLLERLLDVKIVKSYWRRRRHFLSVGSLVGDANGRSVIWGSGAIEDHLPPNFSALYIACVRGPLTRKLLAEVGQCDAPVSGDPALLLPEVYCPSPVKGALRIGVVLHYCDEAYKNVFCDRHSLRFIGVRAGVEEFVDAIAGCEIVFSSSLHGLMIAEAYGKKTAWIKLSEELRGDEFKFRDHYAFLGLESVSPLDFTGSKPGSIELAAYAGVASIKPVPQATKAARQWLQDSVRIYFG